MAVAAVPAHHGLPAFLGVCHGEEDAQAGSLLLTVNEIDGQRIKRVQIEHRRDVELSLEEAPLEGPPRD